jgi:hypothetical protein
MGRAITRADFESVFKQFSEMAVKAFNEDGEAQPMLFCITLDDEPGSIKEFNPVHPGSVVQFYQNGDDGKDMLSEVIKLLTTPGSPIRIGLQEAGAAMPDIVVQIAEAWIAAAPKPIKDVEALYDKHKSIEHFPGRKEVILVALHTTGYSAIGTCPILENPRRAEPGALAPIDIRTIGRLSMTNAAA